MLAVEGLWKSYGSTHALAGIDLEISAGETCCLIGPNGAGKTTLVSIVAGIRRPDAGVVRVGGKSVVAEPFSVRKLLGVAPQELGIYPTITVWQNIALFGDLAGVPKNDLSRRIEEVADILGLSELLGRPVRELSGGEKRRVHTAMAMVHRPPLLLLDEPTSGVDVATRAGLLESVGRLAREAGTAICYSTHYLPEVETLGGSVAIIDGGQIIARGSVESLVRRYAQSAVELSFDGPAPSVVVPGRRVETLGDRVRVYTDIPAADTATALSALGPDAERLRGVEVVSAGLEAVFLSLTGRRYRVDRAEPADERDTRAASARGEVVADVVAP